ncbi:MAG: hypothetical protein ACLFTZ_04975 [Acholeplasmataceae bacterium]
MDQYALNDGLTETTPFTVMKRRHECLVPLKRIDRDRGILIVEWSDTTVPGIKDEGTVPIEQDTITLRISLYPNAILDVHSIETMPP